MAYDYIKLDNAVGEVVAYLHEKCYESGEIILLGFNWHSLSHRTIFEAAMIASKFYDLKLFVRCKLLDYFQLWRKYRKKALFHWHFSKDNGVPCEPIVDYVEKKMDQVGILKEACEAYYNGK